MNSFDLLSLIIHRNAGITNKGLINLHKQVGWRRNPLENLQLLVNEYNSSLIYTLQMFHEIDMKITLMIGLT